MAVYADVLIVLNLYVNYFILNITCRLLKDKAKFIRLFAAALVGGISSLYIFLPSMGIVVDTLFKLITSAAVIFTAFGYTSLKSFVRRIGVFFTASFLFAGGMMGIWAALKPSQLAIKSGVVYINLSPALLIISTLACYLIIRVIRFFVSKQGYYGKRCKLKIALDQNSTEITALVDTGHSLTDAITGKEVIIIDGKVATQLLGCIPDLDEIAVSPPKGLRVIPYSTVGGHGVLVAFTPDKVSAKIEGEKYIPISAIVAITREPLGEDYNAIVSPALLER